MFIQSNYRKHILPSLFLLFVLGQVAFVWWLTWFPTQDGPCHIYNLAILKDLRNGGHVWGAWYEQHLTPTPNWGFHLIAYPLLSIVSPLTAEKIFISIYIILFSAAVPLSLKLLKLPLFPWSFLAAPAIWSYSLGMGFYSFVIALPLLTLAMALTIRMRTHGLMVRFIITTTASAILFVCHLIPFACFALFVLITQLIDISVSPARRIVSALALLAPSTALLTLHMAASSGSPSILMPDFLSRIPFLILNALACSTIYFSSLQGISGVALAFLLGFLIKQSTKNICSDYLPKLFGLYAVIIAAFAIIAPPSLGGGGYFSQRLPTVMLIALIPLFASSHDRYHILLKKCVIPVIVLVLLFNFVVFFRMSALVDEFMSARRLSLQAGSVVMPYRKYGLPGSKLDVLAHATAHYALRSTLIYAGNYEMQFSYFPVRYLPAVKARTPSSDQVIYRGESTDFAHFGSIGYLIAWDAVLTPNALDRFNRIFQDRKLSVWVRSDPRGNRERIK